MDNIDTHGFLFNYSIINHIFLFYYLEYEVNIIENWNEITKKKLFDVLFFSVVEWFDLSWSLSQLHII